MTVSGTTPYPWPYDGRLEPAHMALVIVGTEARWVDGTRDAGHHLRALVTLAEDVLAVGGLVVRVGQFADTPEPVVKMPVTVAIRSGGIDGFYESALDGVLRGAARTRLAVAGFGLEGPVHSTLRSANDRGYECLTLRDRCVPIDPTLASQAYSTIEMSGGIFGAVGTSTALLDALTTTVLQEVE